MRTYDWKDDFVKFGSLCFVTGERIRQIDNTGSEITFCVNDDYPFIWVIDVVFVFL
jgi:hypothetical protein